MENMISMTDVIFISFVIAGLVEIFKAFNIKKEWLQVTSVLIGVTFGVVYMTGNNFFSFDSVKYGVLAGIISGLMASGLYDIQKVRSNKKDENEGDGYK